MKGYPNAKFFWNTFVFLGWLSIQNVKVRVSEKKGTNFEKKKIPYGTLDI